MITSATEYEKAQAPLAWKCIAELKILEARLARLQAENPMGQKGFAKAGIRKLIASLHEELAVFEGSEESRLPE